MLQYLIHSVLFQLVFLMIYELLLKKETYFSYNRLYLLLTPIVSIFLPLIHFESLSEVVPSETLVFLPEVVVGPGAGVGEVLGSDTTGSPSINYFVVLYLLGVLGSIFIFVRKYRVLKQLFRNNVITEGAGLRIIEVSNSRIACTFFSTVFLGDQLSDEQKEQILSHELVHVTQKHSYDLLYFEIFRILFWFNPLIYIYQTRISALHEFMADAGVVRTVEKKTYYQQLLNTAFNTEDISFINQFFNQSLIKKRIVMLQKSRSKTTAKLKFLILIPLLLGMLIYVSCTNELNQGMGEGVKVSESEDFVILHVKNARDLTQDETAKRNEIMDYLGAEGNPHTLVITDGEITSRITVNSPSKSERSLAGSSDVPFMLIEEAPVFPGCEDLASNTDRKNCMTEKVAEFVSKNFNTGLGKALGLKGVNKVYVQFRVNATGSVEVMGVRAPAPELEKEAERVVLELPKMKPGKHNGKEVGVLYSLPITFMVGEGE